eukprot:scaffold291579_cov31-Prasinocladus_malaysianus.AAC.1
MAPPVPGRLGNMKDAHVLHVLSNQTKQGGGTQQRVREVAGGMCSSDVRIKGPLIGGKQKMFSKTLTEAWGKSSPEASTAHDSCWREVAGTVAPPGWGAYGTRTRTACVRAYRTGTNVNSIPHFLAS